VASTLIAPLIIDAFGWQSIFYITSIIGFGWGAVWQIFAASTAAGKFDRYHPNLPLESKYISQYERSHLSDLVQSRTSQDKIPWKRIFKSMPVWAIYIAHFASNCQGYSIGDSVSLL
jgi:ACS family sodium-dependent inorganic phosphate cotransporter